MSAQWQGGLGGTVLVSRLREALAKADEAIEQHLEKVQAQAQALKNTSETLPDALERQAEIHAEFRRRFYGNG